MPATASGHGAQVVLQGDAQGAARGVYRPTYEGNAQAKLLMEVAGLSPDGSTQDGSTLTGAPGGARPPVLGRVVVPLRHRLTLGWSTTMTTHAGLAGFTDYVTVWAPPTAYAARIIIGNAIGTGWTMPLTKFRATNINDGFNPDGAAPWQPFTWDSTAANTDIDWVKVGGAATTFAVPGFAGAAFPETGSTGVFDFYASDFVPILNTGTQVGWDSNVNAWKYLMIRHLRPTAQYSYAAPAQTIGQSNPNGQPFMNGVQFWGGGTGGDNVTTPGAVGSPSFGTPTIPILAVQYLCESPGIQGAIFGDSHANGMGSTFCWSGFFARACQAISTPALPVFPWICGNTGGASDIFDPMFERTMLYQQYSFVAIPAWTWNEPTTSTTGPAIHLSRAMTIAERVRKTGGVPILLSPMPRDAGSATGGNLTNWRDIRARVASFTAIPVFDPVPFVGNASGGAPDGTFLPGMSTDNIHPNDAGHAAIAAGLVPFLRNVIGLS